MNANIDYIGTLILLRKLVADGIITRAEMKKIAARIAQNTVATVVGISDLFL